MNKPFIKLFNVSKKFYFYDVNYNKIVEISGESYRKLANILKKEKFDIEELSDECKLYFAAGLLRANCISQIKNNCNDIMGALNTNLQSLLLQVTQDCNLRCKYCFYSGMYNGIRQHEKKYMNWETCNKCVDFFMRRTQPEKLINLGFYGGEPLLNFKLIKDCVEYIKKEYPNKNIQYSITTNAVLLTPHIFEFLKSHNFIITLSIDGPENIHNANRVFPNGSGSYFIVRKNIEYIYNNHLNFMKTNVRYNAVLTQDAYEVENFFLNDSIFREIQGKLSPLNMYHSNHLSYAPQSNYHKNHPSNLRALINSLKNSDPNSQMHNVLEKLEIQSGGLLETAISSGVCVPGASRLFITVDGSFYMCEKVNEASDEYKIGDIYNGWNETNIYKLANISNTSDEFGCKKCWAIRLCNMCAAKICALDKYQLNIKCAEVRNTAENSLKQICFKYH